MKIAHTIHFLKNCVSFILVCSFIFLSLKTALLLMPFPHCVEATGTFPPKQPPPSSCGSFRTRMASSSFLQCFIASSLMMTNVSLYPSVNQMSVHECCSDMISRFPSFACLSLTLLNPGLVWTRVQIFNTERVRVH